MTATCRDYGNPVHEKCNFCNDRNACEEEFQVRMTTDDAPIIDVTPFLHSSRFEKIKVFGVGFLIGGSLVVVIESNFGIPMSLIIMCAIFGAGYMVGSDNTTSRKTKPPIQKKHRSRNERW